MAQILARKPSTSAQITVDQFKFIEAVELQDISRDPHGYSELYLPREAVLYNKVKWTVDLEICGSDRVP